MDLGRIKKIIFQFLVYYSFFLSLILVVVGLYISRTKNDIFNVVIFFPVLMLTSMLLKNSWKNKERITKKENFPVKKQRIF